MKRKNLLLIWRRLTGNPWTRLLLWILFYIPVYAVLYKIYIPKIAAFGCFDDCFNYVGGYFLSQGRHLYSQIFFSHQPLAAYLSFLIQHFHPSINIFALLLVHRQFVLIMSFCWAVFLSWRFGAVGMVFILVFEFSKFYVFGDRFLAEVFTVYPLVYTVGLGMKTLKKEKIGDLELIISALCTWFVIFMREPYALLAIVVFLIIGYPYRKKRSGMIAVALMVVLTAVLFSIIPLPDYIHNVIVINGQNNMRDELAANHFFGTGIFKIFFYFIYICLRGTWGEFRIITVATSIVATLSAFVVAKMTRQYWLLLFIFIVWGLANMRMTEPGVIYFEAYHMLIWYGLFLFTTFYLLHEACQLIKRPYAFWIVVGSLIVYTWFSPRSFIYQNVDRHTEYITNYGHFLQLGEVIRAVTRPDQTLFTYGGDEFLFVASQRPSHYRYAFYYRPFEKNDRYEQAYQNLLATDLPDVYWDLCTPDAPLHPSLTPEYLRQYTQFYSEGKPTCLYLKTSLVEGLTDKQREKIKEFRYELPE